MKVSLKYQLYENRIAVSIFYFVILCLFLTIYVSVLANPQSTGNFGGMEMSSAIFLFVVGLNSFKETFHMLLQNGVSRRTMFISRISSFAILCAGLTTIDYIFLRIGQIVSSSTNGRFNMQGIFKQIYHGRNNIVEQLLYTLFMYSMFMAVGFFITIAYYRMSKAMKTFVSIAVPGTIFVILPIIDSSITDGRITRSILKTFDYALGITDRNPFHAIITFILVYIVCMVISWLMMRKAVTKN